MPFAPDPRDRAGPQTLIEWADSLRTLTYEELTALSRRAFLLAATPARLYRTTRGWRVWAPRRRA